MKITTKTNFRVIVEPRRLGDFGSVRVPDNFGGLSPARIEKDYQSRCEEIVADIRRHVDNVDGCSIECDTEEVCSHCGLQWEELPEADDYGPKGAPLCCSRAAEEFRASL